MKSDLKSWLSDVTVENDEYFKKARENIDGLPEMGKNSESSLKTAPKAKSASRTSKTFTSRISKTTSRRQRELLPAKHRGEEIEGQNKSMLRLAHQKPELDLQRLKQEEEGTKEEQALMLAELEKDNGRRLAEAKVAELQLTEDVPEASPSLRVAISELSVQVRV